MMERLEARGRAIGEAAVARTIRRLTERLGELPGVRADAGEDRVTVSGRGLWRRLRWIGGLLR